VGGWTVYAWGGLWGVQTVDRARKLGVLPGVALIAVSVFI
jgi:hypothetical protein